MKRIGVVFPGYGEQFIGMGKDLYDELRLVQERFEQAAVSSNVNYVKLLFASSDEEIFSIKLAYPSIFLLEASLFEVLYEKGLRPDFVAGYGIGEYAAAYATQSLSFIDGLYILNKYAQFYDEFIKIKEYTVLRIVREFTLESLESLCKEYSTDKKFAFVSSHNTEHGFYVAGHNNIIEKIKQYCIDSVIRKVKIIGPGYEMHSSLVDELIEQIKLYYHKIKFEPLKIPLITNVDAVYITTSDALESALMRKINNRVQWKDVMHGFSGCDVILSIGPGNQLIEWFKEEYPDKEYYTVITLQDIEKINHLFQQSENINETPVQLVHESSTDKEAEDLYESDLINELVTDFDVDDEDDEN